MYKNECYSHDKEINPSIEICLSCTRPVCRGSCELITKQKGNHIIRRTFTKNNGETTTSYITYANQGHFSTSRSIQKAHRYTEQAAKDILTIIKSKAGPQSKFEVVMV